MKIQLNHRLRTLASTLLTALMITGIISLSLAGYLSIVQQQNFLSGRSQSWNVAIAIVEAGLEEALQHLNSNSVNLNCDGWVPNGNVYTRTRTLPDGTSYTVSIDVQADPLHPSIVSRAYVPASTLAQNRPATFLATIGSSPSSPSVVTRAVRVHTTKANLFKAAMVARRSIDLKGNGVLTDSYHSGDSAKSTNGNYDPNRYTGDMGDVASVGGLLDTTISVQNANIYGYVHTGPNVPVSIGSQGGVGTHAWQATHKGFQPGFVLDDANFTFPETTLPNTSGFLTPMAGDVVTSTNTYTLAGSVTNAAGYPQPYPLGGVTTNTSYVTTTIYPNPPVPGVTTNTSIETVGSVPSPTPSGISTNTQWVYRDDYPDPGTYIGTPQRHGNGWDFRKIMSYSYPKYTYIVPLYSYNFNLYNTNTLFMTNHYDNILKANGKYASGTLSGKTWVGGPNVTLVLPNGLTGAENITFAKGSGVQVHAGGTQATINGNQYINPNGYAASFILYCAPTVTAFTLNGNGQFKGVLVAPEADLVLNGAGSSYLDICGMVMVNSVKLNGHFEFHYDEALGAIPSAGRFLITSWDEIR